MTTEETVLEFDEVRNLVPYCCGQPVLIVRSDVPRLICPVCHRTLRDLGRQWFIEEWGSKGLTPRRGVRHGDLLR